MKRYLWFLGLLLLASPLGAVAEQGIPALTLHSSTDGGQTYSLSIEILLLMTALTLLPALLLMMTSFTRIVIVLAFLRQALGTAQTPPNQVLIGLALFLTLFVMSPVLSRAYQDGVEPYMQGALSAKPALAASVKPFRRFMLNQTRESDLKLFADLSHHPHYESHADVPLAVVVSAFVTSELKTAFEMGFLLYIPFVIIDLVVASTLMSMGMMLVSPMIISLPFKIMLFVLVDGWSLILGTMASSFYV